MAVLVLDAGHDVKNLNTTIPLYFIRAPEGQGVCPRRLSRW